MERGRNRIDVTHVCLDVSPDRLQELRMCLSADESARAARFHFAADRDRFTAARGILRETLARYLAVGPREVEFRYDAHGKPFLRELPDTPGLSFNLSHSRSAALLAITDGRRVGADIEYMRTDLDLERLAADTFTPNEVAAIQSLAGGARVKAFFNCWTRKEAIVKALGTGLSTDLDRFEVSVIPGESARLLRMDLDTEGKERWTLREIPVGPGYAAAVAVEGDQAQWTYRDLAAT
jgi:4'-phosphopantetheinyl transferase